MAAVRSVFYEDNLESSCLLAFDPLTLLELSTMPVIEPCSEGLLGLPLSMFFWLWASLIAVVFGEAKIPLLLI